MQIAHFHAPSRSSTNWLATATAYAVTVAALGAFIFFSVEETRALIGF